VKMSSCSFSLIEANGSIRILSFGQKTISSFSKNNNNIK
jgi:hypothetical protein